jgi:transcriptional regulator with XRE-family HTH domain
MSTQTIGERIRSLRLQRGQPLRVVAAALDVDSSLLNKIEHGERLPTNQQLMKLAEYFEISWEELAAQTIAERIVSNYAPNQTTLQGLKIAEERIRYHLEGNNE